MRHVKRGLTLTRSCDVSAQPWLGRKIHMPPLDDSISAASNLQKLTGRMKAYTVRHCSCPGDLLKAYSFQCISALMPKEFRSLKLGINPARLVLKRERGCRAPDQAALHTTRTTSCSLSSHSRLSHR